MKILDLYIISKFLKTFFFSLAIIIVIVIVIDISERLEDFLEHKLTLNQILFDYYLNFIPYYANLLSPLFVFIAVIFFTGNMAAKSEVVAILSSGTSFYRFLVPYMFAAAIIFGLSYYANAWILPPANKKRVDFDNRYFRGQYYNSNRNIHFQTDTNTFFYVESFNTIDTTGYRFSFEFFQADTLQRKLFADRLIWVSANQQWRLEQIYERVFLDGKQHIRQLASLDTVFDFDYALFGRPLIEDMALFNNRELNDYIEKERFRGINKVEIFELEKYRRLAVPFSTFVLTLIGVAVSSRKVRGGIGLQIGIGIGISFIYIVMMQFTTTFAIKSDMNPLLAVWIPNVIFGILSIYLIINAPK